MVGHTLWPRRTDDNAERPQISPQNILVYNHMHVTRNAVLRKLGLVRIKGSYRIIGDVQFKHLRGGQPLAFIRSFIVSLAI